MNNKKVLIIENDQSIADVMEYILTEAGYAVTQNKGNGCIATAQMYQPNVIMLDYSLSGQLTGDEVCRSLKASSHTAHIPVILTSAITDLKEVAINCGADDVLAKPFDIADLEHVISKWSAAGTDYAAF